VATFEDFVQMALGEKGVKYVFGAHASFDDADPPAFDCSELVLWAAARCGVQFADGAQAQRDACERAGTLLPVGVGIHTRGALLFRIDEGPGNDHVAISLGDGRTIEARGRQFGTNVFQATGRRWTHAGTVPGLEGEDMTTDELLDALASPRGQQILKQAVIEVLRAGFGGLAPGQKDDTVRPSQRWLYSTVADIKEKVK
jgi:cell wall-associated NlpC family hydrolase